MTSKHKGEEPGVKKYPTFASAVYRFCGQRGVCGRGKKITTLHHITGWLVHLAEDSLLLIYE